MKDKFKFELNVKKLTATALLLIAVMFSITACGNNAIGDSTEIIEKERPKEKAFKLIELTPDSASTNSQFLDKLIEGKQKSETIELMLCK